MSGVKKQARKSSCGGSNREEDFELKLLTFHFQSQGFNKTWRHLQRLGWTFDRDKGSYSAPWEVPDCQQQGTKEEDIRQGGNARTLFANAEAVSAFLDMPSLEEIHSNLQSTITSSEPDPASFDREVAQQWRRAILMDMHLKQTKGNDNDDTDSDQDNISMGGRDEHRPRETRRRSSRIESSNTEGVSSNSRSVTALEKGTDLYLHRKTKRKTKKKEPAHAIPTDAYQHANMSLDECINLCSQVVDQDEKTEESIFFNLTDYQEDFPEWRFLLSTNHSLLFFGSGSKRKLLTQFAQEELSQEGHILLIDGFDEDATMDDILNLLVHLFLNEQEPASISSVPKEDDETVATMGRSTPHQTAEPLVERAIAIGRAIAHSIVEADEEENPELEEQEHIRALLPIFLVIHNLDSPNLANATAQDALAALLVNSTVSNHVASIRLVASVEHIDAPMLLWSIPTAANFSWIYKPVHTRVPYTLEFVVLSEEERRRNKASDVTKTLETVQAGRVVEVLRNLAPRHAEVVQILAKLQLAQKKKSAWVDYKEYLTKCQQACAISKDSHLRHFLTELSDHGLVASKMQNSCECVQIPYDDTKLQEIITYNQK